MPTELLAPSAAAAAYADRPSIATAARREHTLEIVSDAGEGAQKCGQIFGAVCARMGNGVWTVEIIPAEIQPPPRIPEGASGYRIRIGSEPVTNWGDETQLVLAFNEQVLLARHRLGALSHDAVILLDDCWASHPDEDIQQAWRDALAELATKAYRVILVPMDEASRAIVDNPRKGKNMFALGVLSCIYARDLDVVREQIAQVFRKKSEQVYATIVALLELGYRWAEEHLDLRIDVPATPPQGPMVVMNGNEALGFGALAAGFELCAMYPITPATSVSHFLGETFDRFGGMLHQAEDEIAAAGVAIGASYAGGAALTVTSGPGLALKTEFIGLAVMTETPLVVVDVQRGGPSTGLPTKVEQSDLLAVLHGQPGDAPKVVMAPATIEECFHVMITARRIAESFRCVVFVLSDANLATGVQPFARPVLEERWMRSTLDVDPVPEGTKPFDWDPQTGLSRRLVPGQANGMHTLTGLEHDDRSRVAYGGGIHQHSSAMRSRKLAVLQSMLLPPPVHGDDSGDLLVVGWGSTKGAIEEAVDRLRGEGRRVSSTHLAFLSPLQPGLRALFARYRRVCTVELNYSDEPGEPYITADSRRYGQLAWMLRAHTLVDVDCWTRVAGEPLRPGAIAAAMRARLATLSPTGDA
jgi:2-oxoglutarate ferredoxin oxidoreductase subunit alpha